jgi:hypothetical protein
VQPAEDRRGAGGRPLDLATLAFFEPRLGADLGAVRVHTDGEAASSARALRAEAYTVGISIVFGAGRYDPQSSTGKELLAHELAHVVGRTAPAAAAIPFHVQRFESPEHIELGDQAVGGRLGFITLKSHDRDFPQRNQPQSAWPKEWQVRFNSGTIEQRRAMTKGLTYGEILALTGDLYADFDALTRAPLHDVIDLIPLIRAKDATTEQFQKATGGRYLALAAQNVSHFSNVAVGQRNIDVWRGMHAEAIQAARAGHGNTAYGLNAGADHFLTDAFSGGHIRTPRDRLIGSAKGNIESKIFHDLDNQSGVRVVNARGDTWVAYGDNDLDDPRNARGRQMALEAVRLSRQDVSDALTRGRVYPEPKPDAAFAAEMLVPHPVNPSEDRFTGRVPTYMSINGTPVRVPDDYTRERDKLAITEGPGIISSFFTDDNEIRDWVAKQSVAGLGTVSREEKLRMIGVLMSGIVSAEDMTAIRKLLSAVTTPEEMEFLRARIEPQIVSLTDFGQRFLLRSALSRI